MIFFVLSLLKYYLIYLLFSTIWKWKVSISLNLHIIVEFILEKIINKNHIIHKYINELQLMPFLTYVTIKISVITHKKLNSIINVYKI